MDRPIIYTGEVPRSADFLGLAKDSLYGLAYLSGAAVGTSTAIAGLAIAPTGPASLSFTIGTGSIYIPETVDANAYSTLGTDTHNVIKQGILNDPVTLTITPPATSGFSQVFLVQVGYLDADITSIVPPYFNSTNPGVPFNGAGGSGGSQNTVRQGQLVVQLKAGTAASTGSQVTPSPDAGFTPVWIVTVANGSTTITSANWVQHASAPYFPALSQIPADVQNNAWTWVGTFGGGANALTATISPAPQSLVAGLRIAGLITTVSTTTTPTLNLNGLGAQTIVQTSGAAPAVGAVSTYGEFTWNGSNWQMASAPNQVARGGVLNTRVFTTPGTSTYTPTVGTTKIQVTVVAGGASGGGSAAMGASSFGAAGGGGAGGVAISNIASGFSGLTITVGAGGAASSAAGNSGGSSSFGSLLSATGGGGGALAPNVNVPGALQAGGSGGAGTGGNVFNGVGGYGGYGSANASSNQVGGLGGASYFGQGGGSVFSATLAGLPGVSKGSGGGGAVGANSGGAQASGAGAGGEVIIVEYA